MTDCICENTEGFDFTSREDMELIARQCIRNHEEYGELTWGYLFETHKPNHWCKRITDHSHEGKEIVELGYGLERIVKDNGHCGSYMDDKMLINLLSLWQPCGFTKSLQEINEAGDYHNCTNLDCPAGVGEHKHKTEAMALLTFINSIT